MAVNIVIGMGGTGSKLIESFAHLCAAGLGPEEEVLIGLIDQDVANGNTNRTAACLNRYMKLREELRASGKDPLPQDCRLLLTNLKWVADQTKVWRPNDGVNSTLGQVINFELLKDDVKDLARSFYSDADAQHAEAELKMPLDEGYRARPHIGSLALLYAIERADWWEEIQNKIRRGSGEGLRVFLFASAFGGTGAAFFPTLAREIRTVAQKRGISRLNISGTLMTPYFSFPAPDGERNVARPEDMAIQTKAALADYHRMVAEGGVFDNLYVVGNDPLATLPKFSHGTASQQNPPLVPELVGALAAARQLRMELEPAGGKATQVFLIGRQGGRLGEADDNITWTDLPGIDSTVNVQLQLGQLFRFCWQWRYNLSEHMKTDQRSSGRSDAWYKANMGKKLSASDTKTVEAVNELVDGVLDYALGMSIASKHTKKSTHDFFRLWRGTSIGSFDPDKAGEFPKLFAGTHRNSKSEFTDLITPTEAQARFVGAAAVFRAMSERPCKDLKYGARRLVATLHKHCSIESSS